MSASVITERLAALVPERLRAATVLRPRYPFVGIEIREDAVVVARLAQRGRALHLAGSGSVPLAEGVFEASLLTPALADPSALAHAVQRALTMAGAESAGRVSLTLPDSIARVFLVDVKDLPSVHKQADEIVRWRIKKSVPFRLEDARISWQPLGTFEDGRVHVLVAVAIESTLRAVESVCEGLGLRVGLVDLASLDLLNAFRHAKALAGAERADIGVLNATPHYFTVMILRGERLIFYRTKPYHVQGGFRGEESLRVFGREVRTTLSYYEEHLLGSGLAEILVRASGVDPRGFVAEALAAGCREATLPDVRGLFAEMAAMTDEQTAEALPAIGLAMRRLP